MQVTDLLQRLGLGRSASKCYAYLYTAGEATASKLAKATGIPRTKTYFYLRNLVSKGFVFEIPLTPKRFRAASVETLKSIVLDQNKALSEIKETGFERSPVYLTIGQANVMRVFPAENAKCRREVLSVVRGLKGYPLALNRAKRAIQRGVAMKILAMDGPDVREIAKTWRKTGVAVKLYKNEISEGLRFTVFDHNLCRITLGRPQVEELNNYTTVWIRSKPVAAMLREYFYAKWREVANQ